MKLIEIIELIRNLCNQHPDINSFHTGLGHEENKDYIDYPSVHVNFPYRMIMIPRSTNGQVEYELKLRLLVNHVDNDDPIAPVPVHTNYFSQDVTANEIAAEIVDETKMREKALRLLNHLVEGIKLKEKCLPWYTLQRGDIISIERANNDMVTGVEITLRFRTGNEYVCEARSIFNDRCGDFTAPVQDVVIVPDDIIPTIPRYSMQFDGVNEYLTTPNSAPFNFEATQPITIGAWINRSEGGSASSIISKWRTGIHGGRGWFLWIHGNGAVRFQMRVGSGGTAQSLIDLQTRIKIPFDEWVYVTITYDGTRVRSSFKAYINGVEEPSPIFGQGGVAVTNGSLITTEPVTIGLTPILNLYGEHKINSINLWGKALSQADIDAEMLLLGAATANTTGLLMENRMGDLATFNGTNWNFPDTLGQSVGFTSANMGLTNRITSIPI